MQVKKDDVTSISVDGTEVTPDKAGAFTVTPEVGEWLVRVHGFEEHITPPQKEKAEPEKPAEPKETAAQRRKREAAEKTEPEKPAE